MAEIVVNMTEHLPGAEYLTAPSIAFGEGATANLTAMLDGCKGYMAQITVPTGSFYARLEDVGTEHGIFGVRVTRLSYDEPSDTFLALGHDPEFVSFVDLRRVLLY
jgi:hypothetical protein